MANAFNIDKGGSTTSDTHLINETFHVFSKSPGSPTTSLGGARLKSGHTTTTSDVWADEIPAFFKAATQAKFDLFKTKAVKDDLCLFNGNVYQHNGTEFISLGSEAEVLVDGATFKKNDKDVIKFHKGRTAINLTADNNNGDGSNNYTAKIYDAATGSTTFVPQFISAMDKMVDGIPSLAYDAAVFASGSQLAEGLTADNDYICNAYAGVIQFNKARSSGVTVNAWEYIGDKLTTSISGLRQSIKDISDVTLKGVVASVTADENTAQKAGITVDNTISTTPVIKFTAGSVATGETKLVTGGAVKTYVETTALAEGGSIAQAIATAKTEAIANAKVTLTAGNGITIPNSGKQDTAFTISVDTNVIATKESVDKVAAAISGVSQTVASIQSELSTGSVATGISEAKAAAQAAMEEAQKKVASVTGPTTGLVTVTGDKDVTITVSDTIATKSYADTAAANAVTTGLGTGGNIAQAIATAKSGADQTAATNLATARGEITTEIGTAVSGLESKLTTGEGSLGKKVEALETATGTTLPAAIEQALTDAKAYSDSLHTTSLDYVVLGDSESLPTASADTLGKIYLVKEGNTANGETGIDAISGSYVEYMTRKVSETEYTWEKIGTTAADLNAYAKTADVTSSIATAKSEAIAAAKTETTTQVSALAATHATDKAALEGSIGTINNTIAAMDADLTVNGISVKQVDGKVTELSEALITASVPAGTTSVEGNVAYDGSAKHVIAPEKFQTAAQMPATLTSWVADLSNLTVGDNMFKGCTSLTVFIGDLSSLTSGVDMFNGCTLDAESLEILAENLPTVTSGTIDIGAQTNATAEVIATIKNKKWTVKSNGTAL